MALYKNDLMEELDNVETTTPKNFNEDSKDETPEKTFSEEMSPAIKTIIANQKHISDYMEKLSAYGDSEVVNTNRQKCTNLLVDLEDLKIIASSLGPNATFEDVQRAKNQMDAEEEKKPVAASNAPKMMTLKNPTVPKTIEPIAEDSMSHHGDAFFRGFVYTAITGGILMGAYMFTFL